MYVYVCVCVCGGVCGGMCVEVCVCMCVHGGVCGGKLVNCSLHVQATHQDVGRLQLSRKLCSILD